MENQQSGDKEVLDSTGQPEHTVPDAPADTQPLEVPVERLETTQEETQRSEEVIMNQSTERNNPDPEVYPVLGKPKEDENIEQEQQLEEGRGNPQKDNVSKKPNSVLDIKVENTEDFHATEIKLVAQELNPNRVRQPSGQLQPSPQSEGALLEEPSGTVSVNSPVKQGTANGSRGGSKEKEVSPDKDQKAENAQTGALTADADKKKSSKTSAEKKLKVLEEKYVVLYKENGTRREELNKMADLVREILTELDISVRPPGEYHLGEISQFKAAFADGWVRYRKRLEAEKKKSVEELRNQEKVFQETLVKTTQDNNRRKDEDMRDTKERAEKSLKNLEELNSKLQRDYTSLLTALKTKETEIAELRMHNQNLSNKAADTLMERFGHIQENDISHKLQESSRVDELIRLKNELDEAYIKIESLDEQVKELSSRKTLPEAQQTIKLDRQSSSSYYNPKAKSNDASSQTDTMINISEQKTPNGSPSRGNYEKLEEKLERDRITKNKDEEDQSSRSYLKNLIIRYLVFEAKRNDTESSVLRRAILDFLKVDSSERAAIDDAVNNRGGLKDSVYFMRLFGSHG